MGLSIWALTFGPALIGMGQLLLDGGTASPSMFELMFVAGGCCIAPLTLGINLFWTVRCWKAGAPRLALILGALMVLGWWIGESGALG